MLSPGSRVDHSRTSRSIKIPKRHPKPPTRGISCLFLVLYGIRIGGFKPGKGSIIGVSSLILSFWACPPIIKSLCVNLWPGLLLIKTVGMPHSASLLLSLLSHHHNWQQVNTLAMSWQTSLPWRKCFRVEIIYVGFIMSYSLATDRIILQFNIH